MIKMTKELTDFSVAAILNLNTQTKTNGFPMDEVEQDDNSIADHNNNNNNTHNNNNNNNNNNNKEIEKTSINISSPDRKKKSRTVFTRQQIQKLENAFDRKKYFTNAERQKLAMDLSLSETQVKIWLQNRRNKWKKQLTNHDNAKKIMASYHNLLSSDITNTGIQAKVRTFGSSSDCYSCYDCPPAGKLLL